MRQLSHRFPEPSGGTAWLQELYALFSPVRDEALAYSEQEIDEAIDSAIEAVRGGPTASRDRRLDVDT
jgi:hypothetical protein